LGIAFGISQRRDTGDETSLHFARLGSLGLFDGKTAIDQANLPRTSSTSMFTG